MKVESHDLGCSEGNEEYIHKNAFNCRSIESRNGVDALLVYVDIPNASDRVALEDGYAFETNSRDYHEAKNTVQEDPARATCREDLEV